MADHFMKIYSRIITEVSLFIKKIYLVHKLGIAYIETSSFVITDGLNVIQRE